MDKGEKRGAPAPHGGTTTTNTILQLLLHTNPLDHVRIQCVSLGISR